MLRDPEPVLVVDLFPAEREALLHVLENLSLEQWQAPTACEGWSVRDVVAHLIGVELGKISRARDGYLAFSPLPGEDPGAFLNRINNEWVNAMRRLSPPVLIDLLQQSGPALYQWLGSVDLYAVGPPVTWAGPEPVPAWLDIAREYTERWHHQQHIREAVDMEGLNSPQFMNPALATFVRALPFTYSSMSAAEGTAVQVDILGPSGGAWALLCEGSIWQLYSGSHPDPDARVSLDEDIAWRLFTNGLDRNVASSEVQAEGDSRLASRFLDAVAIIV